MAKRILIVEDEPGIQTLLKLNLSMAGYAVSQAHDVDQAIASVQAAVPDLVLLDWNLPGQSGVWFVRRLRADAATDRIPVIMLTARDDEHDKILALDGGVDDYLTKPFRVRELLARIGAILRRTGRDSGPSTQRDRRETDQSIIEVDGLRLNHDQRRVTVGANEITLGPTEYRLLHFFVSHPMRVYSRDELLNHVWGDGADLQERTVDAYIGRLRSLIEAAGHHPCIETVRSMGYRLVKRSVGAVAKVSPVAPQKSHG